ncbi:3973_t:CDS:10 [Ambispora leptoticha]|uniref:3973_t:CDS:1 n=1 Tax=Ambispora leptoticha TaxID=144679 RepID=A0A9N9AXI0_9GLOM|nr:3973_t:CDS:10 [Ambispora leptoticha]
MSTNVNEERKRLKELSTEVIELEKEFKKQEQLKRRAKNAESAAELEQEVEFLRNSLKDVYEDILLTDLKFAIENNIEEKLWRNIFYGHVEELRQKLRKIKSEKVSDDHQAAYLELCRYLDLGTGFYHTLINNLKIRENIDLDRIGVELFKKATNGEIKNHSPSSPTISKIRRQELAAECIQRCLIYLGDFARYRETVITAVGERRWEFAQQFYIKATRIVCDYGKAQGQLAVLAAYSNNDLDVVYWYSLSLATKQPSPIAADNLKTFYTKFQQSENTRIITSPLTGVDEFARCFLSIHRLLFDEDIAGLKKKAAEIGELKDRFERLINLPSDSNSNLGTTLKKIILILLITYWDYRNGTAPDRIIELRYAQIAIISIGIGFSIHILDHLHNALMNLVNGENEHSLRSSVTECLPAVVFWCEYIGLSFESFLQLYTYSKSAEKEDVMLVSQFLTNITDFAKSLAKTLNLSRLQMILGDHHLNAFSLDSLPEDLEFLGIIPLRPLQQNLRFNIGAVGDPFKTRMARLYNFAKKLADSKSFEILEFNEKIGQFAFVDEEAKKKERRRVMQLMAEQRLQEQVTSLEQNLQKMSVPARVNPKLSSPIMPTKQCVVDITVVLNHLKLMRKWTSEAKCHVIIPLEVIDLLDSIKKGDNQENARAREAIRFLDQQFRKRQDISNDEKQQPNQQHHGSHFFIRAQKVNEKITPWDKVAEYYYENVNDDTENNNDEESLEPDNNHNHHQQQSNGNFEVMDVPRNYRHLLSCVIYYYRVAKIEDIVLVTDDSQLIDYAKMFKLPVCTPLSINNSSCDDCN